MAVEQGFIVDGCHPQTSWDTVAWIGSFWRLPSYVASRVWIEFRFNTGQAFGIHPLEYRPTVKFPTTGVGSAVQKKRGTGPTTEE
jgi:hypothetical protein